MEPREFPPRPRWRPAIPVDIRRAARTMAVYLDDKQGFVIFQHGTCVVVSESDQPVAEATEILARILNAHPDMRTAEMKDGNWTVQYSQPAMSIVFGDEIDEHWDSIERNHLDGLTPAEVLIGPIGQRNQFDREGKIGLFGRARMFMDASSPVAVGVWLPKLGLRPLAIPD